ncbi:MAG: methylmalonyl-CoA mutase family protein [Candidatus Spyradosoma sp.]
MEKKLTLDEFEKPSYEAWKAVAVESLKGAPFEKKLFTKTPEGIVVEPLYEGVAPDAAFPGFFPYTRGVHAEPRAWTVAQETAAGCADKFNARLRAALERGQGAVSLKFRGAGSHGGLKELSVEAVKTALADADLSKLALFIDGGFEPKKVYDVVGKAIQELGGNDRAVAGAISVDPLCALLRAGALPKTLDALYAEMADVTKRSQPAFRTVGVNAAIWADAGATAVQELGYALATALEYLRALEKAGFDAGTAAAKIRFTFAMGGDFFMSLAKIRAFRALWAQVVRACGGDDEAAKACIHAVTTRRNKSSLDVYVNMLRSTTEATAAVLAGVDSLSIAPFDAAVRKPDDFSRRIAQNLHIILREECCFDKVLDPAGGSPYVESLTAQLAEKAYALFRDVEKAGGMAAAVLAGAPQAAVAAVAAEKAKLLAQRRTTLVGVNLYANPLEKPLEKRECCCAKKSGDAAAKCCCAGDAPAAVSAPKLDFTRAAEPFEKMRAAVWAAPKRPKVFLANMGPVRQHKARADFTTGFFDVGGFEILSNAGFKDVPAAAEAALASGAEIVVVCSTDDTYPEIVPELTRAIKAAKPETIVVLAGYPADFVEAFKAAGVDEFIHVKANCLAVNEALLKRVGVAL